MRKLVRADIRRFFAKPGFYILTVLFILEMVLMVEGETAAEQIEQLRYQIRFGIIVFCFLIFHTLYGDEFRTGFMVTAIGRGYSRAKIVISKLIASAIILLTVTLIAYAAALCLNSFAGLGISVRQNLFLLLYMVFSLLKGIGYIAIAALFLYASWSMAVGIVALVLMSVFGGGILENIQSRFYIPVYDICYDGLLEKSFVIFQAGDFGWQIIPAIAVFVCGTVYINISIFNKKELEL